MFSKSPYLTMKTIIHLTAQEAVESRWLSVAQRLYDVQQELSRLTSVRAQLLDELKQLSDYRSQAHGNFFFTCEERKGAVQYKQIPELKGINLELYRGEPVQMWKLTKVVGDTHE